MTPRIQVSAARRRRSGGNIVLETVFTLLPTFALIFAISDFGLMIFRWNTVQNAVREATRYAVTFQTQAGLGQDASIGNIVQQYAMGFVKTNDTPQHIFVKYYAPSDLINPVGSGGNVPGNIVEVSVQNLSASWIAPLSATFASPLYATTPLNLKVFALDILGGYPVGVTSVTE